MCQQLTTLPYVNTALLVIPEAELALKPLGLLCLFQHEYHSGAVDAHGHICSRLSYEAITQPPSVPCQQPCTSGPESKLTCTASATLVCTAPASCQQGHDVQQWAAAEPEAEGAACIFAGLRQTALKPQSSHIVLYMACPVSQPTFFTVRGARLTPAFAPLPPAPLLLCCLFNLMMSSKLISCRHAKARVRQHGSKSRAVNYCKICATISYHFLLNSTVLGHGCLLELCSGVYPTTRPGSACNDCVRKHSCASL